MFDSIISGLISGVVVSLFFEFTKIMIDKQNKKKFIDYIFSSDLEGLNYLYICNDIVKNIIYSLRNDNGINRLYCSIENDKRVLIKYLTIYEINSIDVVMTRINQVMKTYLCVMEKYSIKDDKKIELLYKYYLDAEKPHDELCAIDTYSLWKYPANMYMRKHRSIKKKEKEYIYLLSRYIADYVLLYQDIQCLNQVFCYIDLSNIHRNDMYLSYM